MEGPDVVHHSSTSPIYTRSSAVILTTGLALGIPWFLGLTIAMEAMAERASQTRNLGGEAEMEGGEADGREHLADRRVLATKGLIVDPPLFTQIEPGALWR
ncbi:hypothetical protein BJ508DRAFT_379402, partial [Ascobolus immersus RN42]